MQDYKDQQDQHDQGFRQAEQNSGKAQHASGQQKPGDRMKDGTNDFTNGDQEENSERSSTTQSDSQNI